MKGLKETTKWNESYTVPNHTYILNEAGNLEAYVIAGTGEYHEFKKPLKAFSKSRRTFKEVEINIGGPF
jgi:hypothetical protein